MSFLTSGSEACSLAIRTTLWLKVWVLGTKATTFRSHPDCEELCRLKQGIVFLSQTSASVRWCQFHSSARVCAWPGTRGQPTIPDPYVRGLWLLIFPNIQLFFRSIGSSHELLCFFHFLVIWLRQVLDLCCSTQA